MATSARYFDLVREMKNAYNHRLRLVESVRDRGIKPTARLFATTLPTVRKWLPELPAARPFRPGRTSPCASPPVSENFVGHRSATRRASQNAAHLRLSPPDPRVRSV